MWSFVRRRVARRKPFCESVVLFGYEPATGYEPAMAYDTSGPRPAIGYEPVIRGWFRCSFRACPGVHARAPRFRAPARPALSVALRLHRQGTRLDIRSGCSDSRLRADLIM